MKAIPNYENYLVSPAGFVVNIRTGRVLKTDLSNRGYHRITVCKGNKTKKFSLHRLVAELYIPNPLNLPTVNHKRTKADNGKDDLEWMTQEDNQEHAKLTGLCPKGSSNGMSKYDESVIIKACELIQSGLIRGEVLLQTGLSKSTFDDIRRRKTWRHISVNYVW